jgi:hypothetical protein
MNDSSRHVTRVFVDTEFTDFVDRDLISIAFVCADGREFYGERSDYDQRACSEFVIREVLPQLGQHPHAIFTREALAKSVAQWLEAFSGDANPRLCFDYAGDWEILLELVGEVPSFWEAERVTQHISDEVTHAYYARHGERHHALYDARANCAGFIG